MCGRFRDNIHTHPPHTLLFYALNLDLRVINCDILQPLPSSHSRDDVRSITHRQNDVITVWKLGA